MRGLTQHQQNEQGRSRWVGGRGKEGRDLPNAPTKRTNERAQYSQLLVPWYTYFVLMYVDHQRSYMIFDLRYSHATFEAID